MPVDIESAPGRGRYDRALTRRQRQEAQRERIIVALAALCGSGAEPSVGRLVELAGIGRNTFYEYFDDVEQALLAIQGRVRSALVEQCAGALRDARTPHERMRALTRAWVDTLVAAPQLARVALRARSESADATQLSLVAHYMLGALSAETAARTALPGLADARKIRAVAAVFDALSREHLSRGAPEPLELQSVLTELTMRLLR